MNASTLDGGAVAELIAVAVQRFPDRVAIRDERESLTYAQLGRRIGECVATMRGRGVEPGGGVAVLASNTASSWIVQAACYALGAYYVGLHSTSSPDDIDYVINDSEVDLLVVDETVHGSAVRQRHEATRACATLADIAPTGGSGAAETTGAFAVLGDATTLARLAYTGGTTGRPKGVMLPNRALTYNAMLILSCGSWPSAPVTLLCSPITHGAGTFPTPTLISGGTIILQEGFRPEAFCEMVASAKVSMTTLVPSMLYTLLDWLSAHEADLSSLELVIYGAAPMAPSRLAEAVERIGPVFQQTYGQTEAPACVTMLLPAEHAGDSLASIGRPYPGIRVALLNEDGTQSAPGTPGELCVRGPLVMDGYWKRPRETADALRGGWLHTGDVAYRDENGLFFLVDRLKDMIISGGFNVYSKEVEDALYTHEAVARAAVIGLPHDKWGEVVTAVVVRKPGHHADAAELIQHVRDRKGAVQTPKALHFVDELPLTAVGKTDKKALVAQFRTV